MSVTSYAFSCDCSEQISKRQSQIDKLYAGLRDLAVERRSKLDEALKLFMLNREVDDLEQWIAEREVVAGSHELGQDYDHVTVRFCLYLLLLARICSSVQSRHRLKAWKQVNNK